MPQQREGLRVVSLIPSATEIVSVLGYGQYLVGRSHECDFPTAVRSLPICTAPKFDPVGSSRQIHERVTDLLSVALSVYRVDVDLLAKLQPTHIITQAQCEVCAVSLSDVERAVATLSDSEQGQIEIMSLQPAHLADVWSHIRRVGDSLAGYLMTHSIREPVNPSAQGVVDRLTSRLPSLEMTPPAIKHSIKSRPRVVCIEWSDPLMAAGNWVPELVALAGGEDVCGKPGEHSAWMSWKDLSAADPDVIVVMPCGYDLTQARKATEEMSIHPAWAALRAVRAGQVYLTDGNQYFNRPGPRLVESCEILAEIIQGTAIDTGRLPIGWERF